MKKNIGNAIALYPHSFGGRGGHGGRQAQLDAGGPSGYHRA